MAKVHGVVDHPEMKLFMCPGCGCCHYIKTPNWSFNDDVEKPTFSPSILVSQNDPAKRCHSFVRDGRIQFLDDCAHSLKGQTVELPDFDHDPWFDQKD